MVNPFPSKRPYTCSEPLVAQKHVLSAGLQSCFLIRRGTHSAYDACPRVSSQSNCPQSYSTSGTLHENRPSANVTANVDRAMRSDAGNAQACPLLHRNFFRQRGNLERYHGKLGGRSEWAIGL